MQENGIANFDPEREGLPSAETRTKIWLSINLPSRR